MYFSYLRLFRRTTLWATASTAVLAIDLSAFLAFIDWKEAAGKRLLRLSAAIWTA